jgi:integrase
MARRIRHASMETRTARNKLKVGKYHFVSLVPGKLALGYRRAKEGKPGIWSRREYTGTDDNGVGHYVTTQLGFADDFQDADGVTFFSFGQAQLCAQGKVEPAGPLNVKSAMEQYIAFLTSQGKPTNDTERRAAAHILPTLGHVEVSALTSATIRNWLAALAKAPALVRSKKDARVRSTKAAPSTEEAKRQRRSSSNRVLTILKAALNHAFDEGKVSNNSAWGRRVKPFRNADRARLRYLTIAEARRLINASDREFRQLVEGALISGARYGQLRSLVVSDFNPDAGTLRVLTRKGDGSEREYHIRLNDEGREFFAQLCLGRASNEIIFHHDNGEPWKPSEQLRPIAEANERARIDPPINFHGLRHTWASHAVMNGVPLMVVAENLGHTTTTMVEKHYGHLAPSFVADAIRSGAPTYGIKSKGKVRALR